MLEAVLECCGKFREGWTLRAIEDQPEDGPTAEDERGWDAREDGEPAPILPSLVSSPEARLNGKVSL